MVRIVASLRESFEECAVQLPHYTLQDEIDKGMFYLFANKNALRNLRTYCKSNVLWFLKGLIQTYWVKKNGKFYYINYFHKKGQAIIKKMIEFEKKASRPRHLFQSSFRLLEEK
ncbi:hypothetical protein Glove_184g55 [Diversispora epigaea]|uniref:Uncharacterized protein n=1 Tax=Diversispora epigaea TaxID=1348612 RepID=A0A397ISC5_9GLOM|nr:hypothetical protein Glove_184g55 [Diversispora epigaea]